MKKEYWITPSEIYEKIGPRVPLILTRVRILIKVLMEQKLSGANLHITTHPLGNLTKW